MGPPLADPVEGGSGPEDIRAIICCSHAGDTDLRVRDLGGDPPHGTDPTFRFNSKCSLLKLLCTLARLCKGTLLQPLRLEFFGIDFPLHPRSQFPFLFSLFAIRTTEQEERRVDPMSLSHSPIFSHMQHNPPNLKVIPAKVHHACVAPFHVDTRQWRNVSLALH